MRVASSGRSSVRPMRSRDVLVDAAAHGEDREQRGRGDL
jgi:hypothetical protein